MARTSQPMTIVMALVLLLMLALTASTEARISATKLHATMSHVLEAMTGKPLILPKPPRDHRSLKRLVDPPVVELAQSTIRMTSQTLLAEVVGAMSRSTVNTVFRNDAVEPLMAQFKFSVPESAYITLFEVTIDGVTYTSKVMEKQEATQVFEEAVESGHSAGVVHERETVRGMTLFSVSVNVRGQTDALFTLAYDEILVKTLGAYELRMDSQTLDAVRVDAYNENGWLGAEAPSVQENALRVTIEGPSLSASYTGFADNTVSTDGRFVLNIMPRQSTESNLGSLLVRNEYFAHVIPPPLNLRPLPKAIVFVIDISGSMFGRRIEQARDALQYALGLLGENDMFNIVAFDDRVMKLFGSLKPATSSNLRTARDFVSGLDSRGGTDINLGLQTGLQMLQRKSDTAFRVPTVVLLTDGEPTSGLTRPNEILHAVRASNDGIEANLYTLGFGFSLNFDLLSDLAFENGGFERRIYETDDTAVQFEVIFAQVLATVLRDITVTYEGGVTDLTTQHFPYLFVGSELLVSGVFTNDVTPLGSRTVSVLIEASMGLLTTGSGNSPTPVMWSGLVSGNAVAFPEAYNLVESTWAYLTVSETLRSAQHALRIAKLMRPEAELKEMPGAAEALEVALKYGMVTPLTSLVVVVPEADSSTPHKNADGGYGFNGGYNGWSAGSAVSPLFSLLLACVLALFFMF